MSNEIKPIDALDSRVRAAIQNDLDLNIEADGRRLRQPNGNMRLLIHIGELQTKIADALEKIANPLVEVKALTGCDLDCHDWVFGFSDTAGQHDRCSRCGLGRVV
jgi:hypothetical protein